MKTTLKQTSTCFIKSIMDEFHSLDHVILTFVQDPLDVWANIPISTDSSILKCSKVKMMKGGHQNIHVNNVIKSFPKSDQNQGDYHHQIACPLCCLDSMC